MTRTMDLKAWKELHSNPPEDWQDKWMKRTKVINVTTTESARKAVNKLQPHYARPLRVDLHVKDGYVVYYTEDEEA